MALLEPCHGSWGYDALLPARGMRLVSGSTMGIQSVCHAPPAKRSLAHFLGVQARLILASGPCHGEIINPYSESFAKPFFFKSHSRRPCQRFQGSKRQTLLDSCSLPLPH